MTSRSKIKILEQGSKQKTCCIYSHEQDYLEKNIEKYVYRNFVFLWNVFLTIECALLIFYMKYRAFRKLPHPSLRVQGKTKIWGVV